MELNKLRLFYGTIKTRGRGGGQNDENVVDIFVAIHIGNLVCIDPTYTLKRE